MIAVGGEVVFTVAEAEASVRATLAAYRAEAPAAHPDERARLYAAWQTSIRALSEAMKFERRTRQRRGSGS